MSKADTATGRWPGGMNNRDDIHDLGATRERPAFLRDALNVDIDENGKPTRRKGYALLAGGNAHSVFADPEMGFAMVVLDGQLCWFDNSQAPPVQLLAVNAAARMSYDWFNDRVYWSNGEIRGYLLPDKSIYPWGIDTPTVAPTLTPYNGGGWSAGTYQIAITWLRDINGDAGEESGAMIAKTVEVAEGQGITVSNIQQPADPTAVFIRIYISPANGDALYSAVTLDAGTTTYNLGKRVLGRMLDTQHLDRMPPGKIVRDYRGRLYTVLGNRAQYSDPLRYGLTSLSKNYFDFPDEVTLFEPVEDGIYVGTIRQTFFLSGADPKTFTLRPLSPHGAVAYSSCRALGSDLGLDYPGPVACWWDTDGRLVAGAAAGQITHLNKALSLPRYMSGATVMREADGQKQLVSSMRHPRNEGFGATDYAVVKQIRNGVIIQ